MQMKKSDEQEEYINKYLQEMMGHRLKARFKES